MNKIKYYVLLLLFFLPSLVYSQTSGGQIKRKVATSGRTQNSHSMIIKDIDWSIVKSEDYSLIQDDIRKAAEFLNDLPSTASYVEEKPYTLGLLDSKVSNINLSEIALLRRVLLIQVSRLGIFSYDYFNCNFFYKNKTIFFQKTTGSQRKSGYLYKSDSQKFIFLGGWSVNDEPLTGYNSKNSVIGSLYKLSSGKYIMLFFEGNSFEIYEFAR